MKKHISTRQEMERDGWYTLWNAYPHKALQAMRLLRDTSGKSDLRVMLRLELVRWDEGHAIRVIKQDLLYAAH